MKRRFTANQNGFTLIELLIAITLLSVILASVYGTYFLSQKAIGGMDEVVVTLQEYRMAMDIMRREFESLFYRPDRADISFKVEDRDLFGAQASRATFTSFSPLVPGAAAIMYFVEEREGKRLLMKKMRSVSAVPPDTNAAEVMSDIDSFMVEVKEGDRWLKTWDAAEVKNIPEAIRITITLSLNGRAIPLRETIAPKLERPL